MPVVFNLSNVFVSYSRRDADFVRKLDQAFKARGLEVWVDWEDIPLSVNWWDEIKAGIEGANVFIFVISPESVASEICHQEVTHAVQNQKRVVPVLFREVKDPTIQAKMHPSISAHNWVFCRETDDFETAFTRLLETINTDFEYVQQHTRLLVRAREWEVNKWENSYLLVGEELKRAKQWLATCEGKEPSPSSLHTYYVDVSRQRFTNQRLRLWAITIAVGVFLILSIALFLALLETNEQRQLAESARNVAEEARAEAETVANENEQIANSISRVSNAQFLFEAGDSFLAIPYALAAYAERDLPIVQTTLSDIAYSPGAQIWLLDHTDRIAHIATSPNALIAASASYDNTIIIWDLTTGENLRTLRGHEDSVYAVDFHPDGQRIASCGLDGRILLWGITQDEPITEFYDDTYLCSVAAFSPDGRWLVTSFDDTNRTIYEIRVWNVETGELVQVTGGNNSTVGAITFAPDSNQFLVGLGTGAIAIWDLEPNADLYRDKLGYLLDSRVIPGDTEDEATDFSLAEPARILQRQTATISDLDFDETGERLLSSSSDLNADIVVWDWSSKSVLRVLEAHTDIVEAAEFVPGTNQIFSAGRDRNMILWNLDTGTPERIMTGHDALPTAAAVSYDGSRAITGSVRDVGIIWDLDVHELLTHFTVLGQQEEIRRLAYHPTEELVASVSLDGKLVLWDMATSSIQQIFTDHTKGSLDIQFALDNTALLTADSDAMLRLWDVASGEQIRSDMSEHSGAIYDIDVSPDGTHALSASQDGDVILWDLATNSLIRRFNDLGSGTRILTVAFHPTDDNLGFASSNSVLFMFNLTTGRIERYFRGHSESVVGLEVSNDGALLVTSDFRRYVMVWDVASGERLYVFAGHQNPVWGVTIDATNRYVASASDDGVVIVWDLEAGAMVRRFTDFEGRVRTLAFSPNSQYLLIGAYQLHHIRLLLADDMTLADWLQQYRIHKTYSCLEQGNLVFVEQCQQRDIVQQAIVGLNVGSVYMDASSVWEFQGHANDVITIYVRADNPGSGITRSERRRALGLLDTNVSLTDARGNELATNDDILGTGTTDSGIFDYVLPADGIYRITVSSYASETFGDYTMCFDISSAEIPADCLPD
jgi:WD40 repeat protein